MYLSLVLKVKSLTLALVLSWWPRAQGRVIGLGLEAYIPYSALTLKGTSLSMTLTFAFDLELALEGWVIGFDLEA